MNTFTPPPALPRKRVRPPRSEEGSPKLLPAFLRPPFNEARTPKRNENRAAILPLSASDERRLRGRGPGGGVNGFTLVELLTVIGIIAVLAAILFPVFATARGKARQTACVSNLRQIGMAVQMYAQDYDGLPPFGADASDKMVAGLWSSQPKCEARIKDMPWLHYHQDKTVPGPNNWFDGCLDSYMKSHNLWRCAGDTGFDYLDNNFDPTTGNLRAMPARPTMYEAYGASYLFHTVIAFSNTPIDSMVGKDFSGKDVGPAQINLLFDGNGSWHGQPFSLGVNGLRYVTLFLDGHAKLLPYDKYQEAWASFPDINPCP